MDAPAHVHFASEVVFEWSVLQSVSQVVVNEVEQALVGASVYLWSSSFSNP